MRCPSPEEKRIELFWIFPRFHVHLQPEISIALLDAFPFLLSSTARVCSVVPRRGRALVGAAERCREVVHRARERGTRTHIPGGAPWTGQRRTRMGSKAKRHSTSSSNGNSRRSTPGGPGSTGNSGTCAVIRKSRRRDLRRKHPPAPPQVSQTTARNSWSRCAERPASAASLD